MPSATREPGTVHKASWVKGAHEFSDNSLWPAGISCMRDLWCSSIMRSDPVDCVVKSPVALQFGDEVSDSVRPGVHITDVVLSEPVNIQEINFKNYYTAYLTVRVLKNKEENEKSSTKWFTCMRNYCLMFNPHTEGGSQDYFSIHRQQMLVEPDNVITVRLILRQPSSVWLNFHIDDIKIYSLADDESEQDIPSWLSTIASAEEPPDLNGLPDPDTVSSSIQHMWALTEMMQSSQTSASIGRFDRFLLSSSLYSLFRFLL
ncbi:Nicolin-1 [Bagarius yarrelli]|uniref:Nicolin-1 n=1 Tax=Bagarius yarrelli TaxID=175774 RepID=A0A556U3X7_BAGYA|nr:Nicolin-1 [Bagarius yarrelli]